MANNVEGPSHLLRNPNSANILGSETTLAQQWTMTTTNKAHNTIVPYKYNPYKILHSATQNADWILWTAAKANSVAIGDKRQLIS